MCIVCCIVCCVMLVVAVNCGKSAVNYVCLCSLSGWSPEEMQLFGRFTRGAHWTVHELSAHICFTACHHPTPYFPSPSVTYLDLHLDFASF